MKKYRISLFLLLFLSHMGFAQTLETIYINESVSTHFITSEPIQYVDISTEHIVGDMPVKNILRLKPTRLRESAGTVEPVEQGIVTIVCQKYMVQYRLLHSDVLQATKSKYISAMDGTGLLLPELTISAEEMKTLSLQLIQSGKKKALAKSNYAGMKISVNGVYSSGDYYFLDVTILNRSNILFETDQLRFHIKDKKVLKSTNVQQIEILPEFVLYHQDQIRRKYRNVLVFKKFTFPNEKIFELEISEKQISGRTMRLQLDYKDILQAEPF
jgi:conjugative transposon TraN protein